MVWKYPDKTGTSVELRLAGRPSNPNGPPTKPEAYSGRNSVALAERTPGRLRIAIKHLLKIRELPLIQLVGRAVQGDGYSHDSFHIIAAVDSHQVDERASQAHR